MAGALGRVVVRWYGGLVGCRGACWKLRCGVRGMPCSMMKTLVKGREDEGAIAVLFSVSEDI